MSIDKVQTAEDLRAAAAHISEHGWTQEALGRDFTGATCPVIAVYTIVGMRREPLPWAYPEVHAAYQAICDRYDAAVVAMAEFVGSDGMQADIPAWNDTPGRTQAEVIAMMEKTAAWVEEKA